MQKIKPRSEAKRASLDGIQRLMLDTIRRPLLPDESMQRDSESAAQSIIKPNDRLTSFDRLQIYNQQYWWRMLGNFAEDFRGLRAVVGGRKFDRLAVAYIDACPSRSWTLGELGARLPGFIEAHPEFTAPHTALALDVARVEWARTFSFDAGEFPPINPQRVGQTPPDLLRLGVQPHVQLLQLRHPVDESLIRLRHRETQAVSNAATSTRRRAVVRLSAQPARTPIFLAVHRHNYSVFYKRLEPEAWRLLQALRAGETLDNACAHAFAKSTASPRKSAEKIREWFATWTALGWLCRAPGLKKIAVEK